MGVRRLDAPHFHRNRLGQGGHDGVSARGDTAHAFRLASDGVLEARPEVVLVGHLFYSVRLTNGAIVFAFRQFQRLREALPAARLIHMAGNHDTPRSTQTGRILRLFEELGVDVATDEPRRLVYTQLNVSILAVPHQLVDACRDSRFRSGWLWVPRGPSVSRRS